MPALLCALVLAISLPASPLLGQAPTLAGVWRFQSEVDTRPDGSVVTSGPAQGWDGYVIYTADGFMSTTIMPKGRQWRLESASRDDLVRTIEDGTSYAGRYEVDAAAGTVTHVLSTSLDPADEGKRLIRRFTVAGDTLTLSGTFPLRGETISFTIRWKRERER